MAISQCKVVDIEEGGTKKLAAILVFRPGTENSEAIITDIWDDLRKTLPPHMVPDYYKIRTAMPVHNNGKRNVCALKKDREHLIPVKSGS